MDNRLAWKSPVPCYELTNPFRTEVMLRMLRGLDQSLRKSLHLGYRIVNVVRLKPIRLPRFKLFSYVCICHFHSVLLGAFRKQAMTLDEPAELGQPSICRLPRRLAEPSS